MDFHGRNMIDLIKQGRTLLFSCVSVMPVICILISAIEYIIYVGQVYFGWSENLYQSALIIMQFNNISLIGLILMFILSKHYKFVSKVSFVCLCALWLLNTCYITFGFEADNYFYCFSSIIYLTFVILTISRLINR